MPVFLSGLVRFQRRGNFFKLHKPRFVRGFLLVFNWNKGVLKAEISIGPIIAIPCWKPSITAMKGILLVSLTALLFSACDVYVVEPRYDARDRIVGKFYVDEYSQTFNDYSTYTFHITKSLYNYDEISIDNFYASGIRVRAYVHSSRITIPYQIVNGYEIEGTGTIYGNDVSLFYSISDLYQAVPTDFCDVNASLIY